MAVPAGWIVFVTAVLACVPLAAAAPGLIMTPTVLDLDETGSAKMYSLQMAETCDPDVSDCVANLLLSGSSTQFTFDPDIIRWKADDWDNVKTVTVTPINNQIDDAVLEFSVQHVVVDQLSNQLFPPTALTVRLTNDDIAAVLVTAPTQLLVKEGGAGASVDVRLNTKPIRTVTASVTVSGSEVSIDTPSLTFSTSAWDTIQTAALTVSNDALAAPTRAFERLVRISTSTTDAKYNRVSEVQQVKMTGSGAVSGSVILTYNGYVTESIPVASSGATVANALMALGNVHTVSVSASANAENGFTWLVTFTENSGDLPSLVVSTGSLTGSGAAAAVTTVTTGVPKYTPEFSGEFLVTVVDDDLKVTIVDITAANTGNQAGPGNGDTMTLRFSEDTNRPAVGTKAGIDALFSFSTTIGTTYTGEWALVDVPGAATMGVTAGSTSVSAAGDMTAVLEAGDELVLNTVTYTVSTVAVTGGTAQSPTSTVTLTSAYVASSGTVSAKMRSRSSLVITLTNTAGITSYPDMRVGTLQVSIKASGSLSDRYSASSAAASTTTVALGTWGAMAAPQISAATAGATGNQAGIGVSDRLVVTFDSATNRAGFGTGTMTKANVDALFSFTSGGSVVSLGTSYTGTWESDTQLRITLLDITGASSQRLTRVGALVVSAKVGNAVKSFDATSTEATGSATLTGDWGQRPAPTVSSIVAADAVSPFSASPGISVGDTMTVTFDSPTNMPPVTAKSDITTWLSLSANVGAAYSGVWSNDGQTLTITLTDLTGKSGEAATAVGTLQGSVTALLKSADESSVVSSSSRTLSGTWGARAAPTMTSAVASDPGTVVGGHSQGDVIVVTFDVDVNTAALSAAGVSTLFSFSAPGVSGSVWDVAATSRASGTWLNARQYQITVGSDVSGIDFANTRVSHMVVTARSAGGIRTLDASSVAASSGQTLTGTWGARAAPALSSAVASAEGGQSGLGTGDRLTLTFDSDTNRVAGSSEASVAALVSFSTSIGQTLTGVWSTRRVLVITIADATGAGAVSNTRVGSLTVNIQPAGNLLTSDLSSPASASSSGTTGTWGDYPAPTITAAEAIDPVSSLASAGYTSGDTLRLTFDINTNRMVATSMTKSQVDTLLSFTNGGTSVNMGTDYTGSWTNANTLVITIVDAAGADAARTAVGALRVTVKSAAGLKSEDLSSPNSASSAVIGGTWGDFPAPAISSATAADAGTTQPGLGVGDTITLVFDQTTNKAGGADSLTKAGVDALLSFSASIGLAYTAVWSSTSELVITIATVDTSVSTADTAVGTLYVQVKLAANLRSLDESSGASQSVGLVDLGTWGDRAAPALTSAVASNAGNNEGIGNSDQVVITFDAATRRVSDSEVQTVTTSASAGSSVGGSFTLSYRGATTATIDRAASAAVVAAALNALPSIGAGGVTVTRTSLPTTTGGYTWTVTFTDACRYGVGDLPALQVGTSGLVGTGATATVAQVVAGGTISGARLSSLLEFSSPLGATVTGVWNSATTLILTINDATGASLTNTAIGTVTLSVKAAANLRSADKSSPAASATNSAVTGTWGPHTAPQISATVAADAAPLQAGIGNGDTVTITFNKATNRVAPSAATKAGVASLFTLSAELGAAYSGVWTSATTFVITISDATGADVRATRVGQLQVTAAGNIRSADLSSPASTSVSTLSGSWGDHTAPVILSAVAQDIAPVVNGISDADVVDITFDKATNQPSSVMATLFTIDSSLGAVVGGAWTSSSVYRITITSASGASAAATRVGLLTVTARTSALIKAADESSPSASNGVTLSGSWGDHTAPAILSAVAADAGSQPGVGVGDTLTLNFDMDVNRAAGAQEANVGTLVSTSAPIGSSLVGQWTDARTLRITIINDSGKGSILATQVGVMTVTLRAGGGLQSADLSSPVSEAAQTLSGDWGQFPSPTISSAIAADPVSSPATAGLSAGDTLTLTFTMNTNEPAVATTTQVNTLLSFSATVGTDYTGVWTSPSVLRISFSDTGGSNVVDTRVNHLQVTVRAEGNLKSSDGSSQASTSTAVVTGSWGPFAKPTIASMTAADGAPTQGGIGNGDTLTIVFNAATNSPSLPDAATLNTLFTFNAPIATAMAGTWADADRLVITINTVDADAAGVNAGHTRVGGLFVQLNPAAALRSADLSSPAADGFGYLDNGSWGVQSAPVLASVVAADTANNEGIAVSDTMSVNFDKATGATGKPAVQTVTTSSVAAVGGTFRLTFRGYTSGDVSAAATSGELATALQALPPIGSGGVSVTRTTADAGLGTFVWRVTFLTTCRMCTGAVPALVPTSSLSGSGAQVSVAVVDAGDVLDKTALDALLGFSASLGAGYRGKWSSDGRSLVVTLTDLTGAAAVSLTVPTVLEVSVKSTAQLLTADRSSTAASGSMTLGGTWGVHSKPIVTSAVASNGGASAGINIGDTVTINFNKATNQPTNFANLVAFNPATLGRSLSFNWASPSRLIVIVGAVSGTALPVSQTRVGLAQVSVLAAGNARSADLTSPVAEDTVTLGGTWGDHPPPRIVTAVASNGEPATKGIGVGDTITLSFDQVTNTPDVSSNLLINNLLGFSSPLGTLVAAWTDASTLALTLTGVQPGDDTPALTRVGLLRISMQAGNLLRSMDLSSPEGAGSSVLQGSYGAQDPPQLVTAVATDDGGAPGLNTGDKLTLTFDRSTNLAPDAGPVMQRLISFSAAVGPISGTWTSRRVLELTFLDTSARAPPQDVVAGVLQVFVHQAGGLRSADESSVNGTGTGTIAGSFGAYPAPALVSVVASNTGNQQGIGVGDSYLLTFTTETDAPSSSATLGQLVQWTADPGTLTYAWQSATALLITITSQTTAAPAHLTRIGLLECSVKSHDSFLLKSADGSSPGADTAAIVTGTYGPHDPPAIASLTAVDTGMAPGLNNGDTVQVTFNKATNIPGLGGSSQGVAVQKARVDGVFSTSADVGLWYRGTWNTVELAATASVVKGSTRVWCTASVQGSLAYAGGPIRIGTFDTSIVTFTNSSVFTLAEPYAGETADYVKLYGGSRTTALLTITNTSTADPYKTRVGGLRMAVRQLAGLRSSDLTSEPSVVEATLGGSWGPQPAPKVTSVVASDVDQEPGVGTGEISLSFGDTLAVSFDSATNAPDLDTAAKINAALNFSASIGSNYVGSWLTRRLTGFARPVVGASVLPVTRDLRNVLSRGEYFRVGLTLLQVGLSGAFTPTSVPLAYPFPAEAVSMTVPSSRRLMEVDGQPVDEVDPDEAMHHVAIREGGGRGRGRGLATNAEIVAAQKYIYVKSNNKLLIVILDPNGASIPSLTAPGVLHVGVLTLRSADESSPLVNDVKTVSGSWNPAPVIVQATANHGTVDAISHGLDNGDFVLVVFNVETTTPLLGAKANVDAVFQFSASLGADYTGLWLNPSVAKLTIVDATGAASAALVRAGELIVQVKAGANVKARIGDSGSSLSLAPVVGLWGSELPPELITVTAVNGNDGLGVAGGDRILLNFDHDTNTPPVSPTPEEQTITLTSKAVQESQVIALTGGGVSGFFKIRFAPPTQGTVVYTAVSEDIATSAVATRAEEVGGAFGTGLGESVEARLEAMPGVGEVTVSARINGATGGKEWTVTFNSVVGDVPTLQVADTSLSFPQGASGLGAGVEIRQLVSGLTLGGHITVTMDGTTTSSQVAATATGPEVAAALTALPQIDGATVNVVSVGPGGSVAWLVTFTANVGELPQMAITTNALTGDTPTVAIATIVNGVTSQGQLVSMFDTSSPLPAAVSATWTTARQLTVTLHQPTFTDDEAANLASLRVAVRTAGAVVRSAGGTTAAFGGGSIFASGGGISIGGSFGPRAAPVIVSAAAVDGSSSPGLAVGDVLVITFDVDTNMPNVAGVDAVDRVLHMTAALGCTYTGVWPSRRELRVTVTNTDCTHPRNTGVGQLVVTVRGSLAQLRSADLTSADSTSSATLSGSWGTQPAPYIVSATARDSPTNPAEGVSDGDQVTIVFSSPIKAPWDVATNSNDVDQYVQFNHGIGVKTAEWVWVEGAGTAVLSDDRSHLLFTSRSSTKRLGPGTAIRFGGADAVVAATPTAFSIGASWPLSSEQLGNPATVDRLLRSSPLGVLPLAAPLANVPDCTAGQACVQPVLTRSPTTLRVTITDASGAGALPEVPTVAVGFSNSVSVVTQDGGSPPASSEVTTTGTFGDGDSKRWHELWWVWFLIAMIVLMVFCIGFWWVCLKRNYVVCFKNSRMGGTTFKPHQRTEYSGQLAATSSLVSSGEALHAYRSKAVDPRVLSKAVSGFKRASKNRQKHGAARLPSTAPNVVVHTYTAPEAPVLPPATMSARSAASEERSPLPSWPRPNRLRNAANRVHRNGGAARHTQRSTDSRRSHRSGFAAASTYN